MTTRREDTGESCYVFAYGSNLFVERMVGRVSSAEAVGLASLPRHQLRFHLRSAVDGSGKADAFFTGDPEDRVEGVVYRIDSRQLQELDRHEATYHRTLHEVWLKEDEASDGRGGSRVPAWCYHALPGRIDPDVRPFDWYHELVLEGARRHALPPEYVEALAAVSVVVTDEPSLVLESRVRNRSRRHDPEPPSGGSAEGR